MLGEQPVELAVQPPGQGAERLDVVVIMGGESAADVEDLDLVVAAAPGLHEDAGRQLQGLDVVLEVGALAADVEADPLDHQPGLEGGPDQVDGLAGRGAELARQLHHRAGVGHLDPQTQARVRGVLLDLANLFQVVVGHQRLVLVQLLQRLGGLDRVGVDDLVPDVVLPPPAREVADVLVDDQELGHAGHVKAGPDVVKRLDDGGVGVGLDGIVRLDARQVLLELEVVGAQDIVVDHEERRAVLPGQLLQESGACHFVLSRVQAL